MTQRTAQAPQHGTAAVRHGLDVALDAGRPGFRGAELNSGSAAGTTVNAHQPMTLHAVLRHTVQIDRSLDMSAHLASRKDGAPCTERAQTARVPAKSLQCLNEVLNTTLDACVELDTARLQLQNALVAQLDLETVLEMLTARIQMGQACQDERRKLAPRLLLAREVVNRAVGEWHRLGRHFTRITRLLPTQLGPVVDHLGPIPLDEMERLAEAFLWAQTDANFGLQQCAQAWASRCIGPSQEGTGAAENFCTCVGHMEAARAQLNADVAKARDAHLQAVLGFDREHAGLVKARSLRRTVEGSFRLGARSALELADAIVEESRCIQSLLALQSQRLSTRHRLLALAGLLPRQFGWAETETSH